MTTPGDPFAAPEPGARRDPAPGYGTPSSYGPPPAWGQPPAAGQWSPPAWQGPAQTEGKAIVALVCAIGSFLLVPVIPAVVALVLASSSKREIQASGGRLTGDGLVTAARILAWINLGLAAVVIALVVLFFVLALTLGSGSFTGT